ncbi:hypothetical protein [Actinoplanes sp. NPDC049599]
MRIGIIGCGRIARNHVAALRAIAGVEVGAVADAVNAGSGRPRPAG